MSSLKFQGWSLGCRQRNVSIYRANSRNMKTEASFEVCCRPSPTLQGTPFLLPKESRDFPDMFSFQPSS
ncbi:hypothetical protein LEMLEM_LOCUS24607 [Lemmus lemmus]